MSTTGVTSSSSSSSTDTSATASAYSSLSTDDFMKLFIAEMQNQDPTNPMETSELVAQLNEIWQMQTSQEMIESLEAVTLGQHLSAASNLLGRTVTGLTDDAETVTGRVAQISIEEGVPRLVVGDYTISLESVSEIAAEAAE